MDGFEEMKEGEVGQNPDADSDGNEVKLVIDESGSLSKNVSEEDVLIVWENVSLSHTGDVNYDSTIHGPKQVTTRESEVDAPNVNVKLPKTKIFGSGYVLGVKGMMENAATLKQLLRIAVNNKFKIRPRFKGEDALYIYLQSEDDLKAAETFLHNRKFGEQTLTAEIVDNPEKKFEYQYNPPYKKLKLTDNDSKKPKKKTSQKQKVMDVGFKLTKLEELLITTYPQYDSLITDMRQAYGGLLCTVEDLEKAPPHRCTLNIGLDETNEPAVGFNKNHGIVKTVRKTGCGYADHLIRAAEVFEKAVKASSVAPSISNKTALWHKVIIQINSSQELIISVLLNWEGTASDDDLKTLKIELREFFENGEGKHCRVIGIFTKNMNGHPSESITEHDKMELIMGSPIVEEKLLGFKVKILKTPSVTFQNNDYAYETMCRNVEGLLSLKKHNSLLMLGCDVAPVGFYLSKIAREVIFIDSKCRIKEIRNNAAQNNITNCRFYSGEIPVWKIRSAEPCAIFFIPYCSPKKSVMCMLLNALNKLREVESLKRIVLVIGNGKFSDTVYDTILSLCNPNVCEELHNPFFPVRVIPIHFGSNANYVILILMERIVKHDLSRPTFLDYICKLWDSKSYDRNAGRIDQVQQHECDVQTKEVEEIKNDELGEQMRLKRELGLEKETPSQNKKIKLEEERLENERQNQLRNEKRQLKKERRRIRKEELQQERLLDEQQKREERKRLLDEQQKRQLEEQQQKVIKLDAEMWRKQMEESHLEIKLENPSEHLEGRDISARFDQQNQPSIDPESDLRIKLENPSEHLEGRDISTRFDQHNQANIDPESKIKRIKLENPSEHLEGRDISTRFDQQNQASIDPESKIKRIKLENPSEHLEGRDISTRFDQHNQASIDPESKIKRIKLENPSEHLEGRDISTRFDQQNQASIDPV